MEKSNKILNILKSTYASVPSLIYDDIYQLLISVMLSQQATDKKVNEVARKLYQKYPDFYSLGNASVKDVENIISSLGLYHVKARNIIETSKRIIDDYNGIVPDNLSGLLKLPGVGRKTASVVLLLGYDKPALPVDTHVKRVAKRLGLTQSDNPLIVEKDLKKIFPSQTWHNLHLGLIYHGRYQCYARKPKCDTCPLKSLCDYDKRQV